MIGLLLSLTLAQYTPQEAQALFVEANDAYYRGELQEARSRYEKLLNAGLGGPDVLFNLGTTCLAANQLGPATLYLERAARMADDDDIGANLSVAHQRQVDQVVGAELASVPFTQRLAAAMEEQPVAIAFLITWFLGFACAWWAWKRGSGNRLLVGLLAAVFLLVAASLGSALAVYQHVNDTVEEGIVMPDAVQVREFPGATAHVAFEVHAGLKVRIMESSGTWVRIRLPNALEGWAEKDAVVAL